MKYLELSTGFNDESVWINPLLVAALKPSMNDQTAIHLSGFSSPIIVAETPMRVAELLSKL